MSHGEHKWIIEYTSPSTAHMFAVTEYIVSRKTEYQQVEIAETPLYGRMLLLDGKIQSAEYDEYIYHEALVHPAMLMFENPRSVLIVGGGEGATLREVFKYKTVEKLVMVDLDREVVGLCQQHMEKWHQGSFADERLELHFMDAREYLENSKEKFDIIISDVPEPVENGPALKLFTKQYFELISKRLNSNGFLVMQAGDFNLPFLQAHALIFNTVRQVMPIVSSYHTTVPSFNSDWSFVMATTGDRCIKQIEYLDQLIDEKEIILKFIDGQTINGMFTVPKNIRQMIEKENRIIDDNNLLKIY